MPRTATLLTLACLVIASAAVAGFIAAQFGDVADVLEEPVGPVANRDGKADRLARATIKPPLPLPDPAAPTPTDLLRQAYATEGQLAAPDLALPSIAPIVSPPLPSPRPRLADMQKSYTLLSDMQIAGIKTRLQLTSAQAKHWPAVEDALRAVANRMHALKQTDPHHSTITLAPDTPEMQRLKAAATPLLAQLREDQKREVRALARIIGLDAIASRI